MDFFKAMLKDHRVGAITRSSKYVIRKVLRRIDSKHHSIIELGAGDGIVTKEILKRIPPNGKLVAIELNPDFINTLHCIRDNRLTIEHIDALTFLKKHLRINQNEKVDAIISNIPFTFIDPSEREEIVSSASKILQKEGCFIVYQYSPFALLLLKKYFSRVTISLEPRNLFPYFVMTARK